MPVYFLDSNKLNITILPSLSHAYWYKLVAELKIGTYDKAIVINRVFIKTECLIMRDFLI